MLPESKYSFRLTPTSPSKVDSNSACWRFALHSPRIRWQFERAIWNPAAAVLLIKRVVLSTQAQTDLAGLDRAVALRIAGAINRFAETGAGNTQGPRGIEAYIPQEFRLRVGDWRVRFHDHVDWIDILRIRNRRDAYR